MIISSVLNFSWSFYPAMNCFGIVSLSDEIKFLHTVYIQWLALSFISSLSVEVATEDVEFQKSICMTAKPPCAFKRSSNWYIGSQGTVVLVTVMNSFFTMYIFIYLCSLMWRMMALFPCLAMYQSQTLMAPHFIVPTSQYMGSVAHRWRSIC